MRFFSKSVFLLSATAFLVACSDNGSSNTTISTQGWVGAQDFNQAQVIANQVTEGGQVSVSNDIYIGTRESTDSGGYFTADVEVEEVILFIARGQIADVDEDYDNIATLRQCLLKAGCSVTVDASETDFTFGEYYTASSGFEWRSVAYSLSSGSDNNVNPITTLAAAYAYQYDVLNYPNNGALSENEVFTAYDVILANSQVSELLGLNDIIGDKPANLTTLNSYNTNTQNNRNEIRYGALIAAIQQKDLDYRTTQLPSDEDYVTVLAQQFMSDEGQLYYNTNLIDRVITLHDWYQTAYQNLELILPTITNVQAKAAVNQVITELKAQATAASNQPEDTKTTAVADDLTSLLTTTEQEDFNLGLEKTKLFVNSLLSLEDTFWVSGYKEELDEYLEFVKTLGDTHKDNLNDLVQEFIRVQDYYVTCIIGGDDCSTEFSDLEALKVSYDASTKVLVMNNGAGGQLEVSQKIADTDTTDDEDSPVSSYAMDVYITGTLEKNNLVLNLAHDLDSSDEDIDVPSAMRLYYSEEVSEIDPSLEIGGYELIWGFFELFDKSSLSTNDELELSGAFSIFYRGVRDPQNTQQPNDSELRFNIDNWTLSSAITDQVGDEGDDDRETTTLIITGSSSNPIDFYPANEFSSFNAFFEANEDQGAITTETGLLTYKKGEESVLFGGQTIDVSTVDFFNKLGDDVRYRFYPTESVEDEYDSDNDGDYDEYVDLHRIEVCDLDDSGAVEKCGPKSKVYDTRNVQNTINDLWELGVFQQQIVDGRGTYFVDFPMEEDEYGCKVLQTLEQEKTMDGTLIESQVLGLNSLRVYTQISLEDDNQDDLSDTLFDMTVYAPQEDQYKITAGLSHNYSSSYTDSSGIILGSGSSKSVLYVSYDTTSDFENTGSITISKSGVDITTSDGDEEEDQIITSYLTQTYDPSTIQYITIEDEDGLADRCVLSTGADYVKDTADEALVFYLNYRGVVYGTIRQEGANDIWTIRYIDGTWMTPSDGISGS